MKKIIYAYFVAVFFLSACNNEEIRIDEVVKIPTYTLTYGVNTQSAFDELNTTNDVKNRLLSGTYSIGTYLFLYNQSGNLVASDSLYSKTFDMSVFTFTGLPNGKYTAITINMLVDADEDNSSDFWVLVGKEKLSTLEISSKYTTAYWYGSIGLSTDIIDLKSDYSKNISPKAIGSKIHVEFHNLGGSGNDYAAFYTKNAPIGRYLNPALTGDARFHYAVYTEEHVWDSRGSKRDSFEKDQAIDIFLLESGRLNYALTATAVGEDGSIRFTAYPNGNSYWDFEDGKIYYAGLYYLGSSSPRCAAGIFADQSDYLSWLETTATKVQPDPEPVSLNFDAPCLNWGVSVSDVKSYMANTNTVAGNNGDINTLTLENGSSVYYLYYEGKSAVVEYDYYFETATSNLQDVFLFFQPTYTLDDLLAYYKANTNYNYFGYDSDIDVHLFMNETEAIWLYSDVIGGNTYPIADYFSVSSSSDAKSRNGIMDARKKFKIKRTFIPAKLQLDASYNVESDRGDKKSSFDKKNFFSSHVIK